MSESIIQPFSLGEAYAGVRATPMLVGREVVLEKVKTAFQDRSSPYIVYVTGPGGTGKTRLISQCLDQAAKDSSLITATNLIDLYHTRIRSVGGFVEALLEVVKPLGQYIEKQSEQPDVEVKSKDKDKLKVDVKLQALARAEQEGVSPTELFSQQTELTEAFLQVINQITKQHRLILALDTAERLFVARDVAQERLGLDEQRPAILDWLLNDFLPGLKNTVVLLAGRPKPLNLTQELSNSTRQADQIFLPIALEGFVESEALAYFDALIQVASKSANPADVNAARTMQHWSEEERRAIFYCLHDGGDTPRIRPILLALTIDHLVVSGQPMEALTRPLSEARDLSHDARVTIQNELGKTLIQTLREYRRPADDIIITLGWLRKGANVSLLARLLEMSTEDVEKVKDYIKDLSFIKIRPSDERIFLHDEMYDLLQQFALDRASPGERRRIYETLTDYYRQEIEDAHLQIDQLYRPKADTATYILPDPVMIRTLRSRLHDAIVDDLHYRLRWNIVDAFDQYFIYAEDAIDSYDESLSIQLRAELLSYLAERDPGGKSDVIDGLPRADVAADAAIRWVEWFWRADDYEGALKIAERLRNDDYDLIEPGGDLAKAELNSWYAYLLTYAGRIDESAKVYQQAFDLLKQVPRDKQSKRWAGIAARALNNSGFTYRVQTRPYRAIEAYERAIHLWRQAGLVVGESNTLNNRAYALAIIGKFDTAMAQVLAGLRLDEQLGPRAPVGLSVNTMAMIELRQNDLEGARRDARRAMDIFRQLNSQRGLGLSLTTMAEAEWRTSESPTYIQEQRSAELLERAINHVNEAISIFENEIQEPVRLREALREKGRIYRSWVWLRREHPAILAPTEIDENKIYTTAELASESRQAFDRAAQLAQGPANEYNLIEILLDIGQLDYYHTLYAGAPNFDQAQETVERDVLSKIDQLIPGPYYQTPPDGKRFWYFVLLGQLHLLRGHIAFNAWYNQQTDDTLLQSSIEYYTLALTTLYYFSTNVYKEMREALDTIYHNLNLLDPDQKLKMYEFVQMAEKKHNLSLGKTRMNHFLENRFGTLAIFASPFDFD